MTGPFDISREEYRNYEWLCPQTGGYCTYTINKPKLLYVGKTTHRVVDIDGMAHCVPNVGYFGCVVTWKNPDGEKPVNF